MIVSFRHKGLKRLFRDGDRKGVSAEHIERIENILGLLDAAEKVEDMDIPTLIVSLVALKAFGPLLCVPTGESFFASRLATLLTLI
jgi:hypothetical protein